MKVELNEWQNIVLEGEEFTDPAARLVAQTLTEKGIVTITELKNGISIQSNSHIGKMKVGHLQININPKIEGMPLYTLLKYAYGLRDLKMFNTAEHAISNFSFFDLLIWELVLEAEDLMRRGIQKSYVAFENDLSSPRGRINMNRLAAQGGITKETLPCNYFQRDENHLLNRVLLAGLKLASNIVADEQLKVTIRRLCTQLEEQVDDIKLTRNTLQLASNHINRLTERYRSAIELIHMLYASQGVQFEDGTNSVHLSGYFFDMNRFFETLVGRLLSDFGGEYKLKDQFELHHLFTYAPNHNPKRRRSPTPRPDFALIKDGKVVKLLDAKYRDLWERNLPSDMLYQLAIYAMSGVGNKTATIIYPAMSDVPIVQKIDIKDPITGWKMGSVILWPLDLVRVADLLSSDRRSLRGYLRGIVVGDRISC